jgi:hypothetical protein
MHYRRGDALHIKCKNGKTLGEMTTAIEIEKAISGTVKDKATIYVRTMCYICFIHISWT